MNCKIIIWRANLKDTKSKAKQKSYIEQIVQFYDNKLPSNQEITVLQHTPQYLIRLGAKQLPVIIKQSTLNKCIRSPKGSRSAHSLSRKIIESIPNEMESPIMVVKDKARDTLVLICHGIDQSKNHLLIPLQLNNTLYGNKVNEIKSIYGKTALHEYLIKNEEKKQVYAIDIKKPLCCLLA